MITFLPAIAVGGRKACEVIAIIHRLDDEDDKLIVVPACRQAGLPASPRAGFEFAGRKDSRQNAILWMMKLNLGKLIVSIAVCQGAGLIGSIFTFREIPTWYATLAKPSFNPPSWIFGPVWITLYALMGIALYLVLQKGIEKRNVKKAVALFGIQLVLNSLWSVIFFGLKDLSLAFLEILVLLGFILATIVRFYHLDKKAAYLLLPYLAWSSFATYLTFTIWTLN
jgi:benzodiazapine receptor